MSEHADIVDRFLAGETADELDDAARARAALELEEELGIRFLSLLEATRGGALLGAEIVARVGRAERGLMVLRAEVELERDGTRSRFGRTVIAVARDGARAARWIAVRDGELRPLLDALHEADRAARRTAREHRRTPPEGESANRASRQVGGDR